MSQELDYRELQSAITHVMNCKKALKAYRRELLEKYSKQMLPLVRSGIGGTGRVQGWQGRYVLSGYTAVRPISKHFWVGGKVVDGLEDWSAWDTGTALGAITNAIESGHKIRQPSGRDPKYRYRGGRQKGQARPNGVPGKKMYKHARSVAATWEALAAKEWAEAAAKAMK
ncbi:MAG: hypothetical protein IJR65_08290 [Oscillospiraceae bacterium]|nr:hypothetical protein [Oscillospiraceae bacterium]